MYEFQALFFVLLKVLYFLDWGTTNAVNGHKILMVPVSMSSHQLYFGKLGQGLSNMGHHVEMISASSSRIPKKLSGGNFTITVYPVKDSVSRFDTSETSEKYIEFALSTNVVYGWWNFYTWFAAEILTSLDDECEHLLDNIPLMNRLINQTGFEFVIIDVVATDCYSEIVKTLNKPYGVLSIPFMAWHFGIPRLPSFVPNHLSDMSDRMTFTERFKNLLNEMLFLLLDKFVSRPSFKRPYMKYGEHLDKQSFFNTVKHADLHFYLEDLAMSYPRPSMPNVVSVGDIMAGEPGSTLSPELDRFLGKGDAILFSFGSYIQVVTENISRKYCKSFQTLKEIKIIWRLNDSKICSRYFGSELENLLVLPWVPQNDLLADDRIKAFITHGGFNSMMESIYHAKPVIVFPIAIDQHVQAGNARVKKYGIHMDMRYWESEDLVKNVEEILNNPLYRNNAKLYSDILKSKSDTPAERVSNAINFVMKFGSQHLKSASLDLYWFQLFMFDICVVILITIITMATLWSMCCICLAKRICRRKIKLKKL